MQQRYRQVDFDRSKTDGSHGSAQSSAARAFQEPLVHESALRKAHIAGRLSVDPDAGQRCVNCSTCPGFDVHHWRKVCKWCRCGRQDHERKDDRRTSMLNVASGLQALALGSTAYAWEPQGLKADEVAEFFAVLPRACVPAIGTEGEEWRRQQLLLQQPPHDTDYTQCDQLTGSELEWFKKFDSTRMREAFDVSRSAAASTASLLYTSCMAVHSSPLNYILSKNHQGTHKPDVNIASTRSPIPHSAQLCSHKRVGAQQHSRS